MDLNILHLAMELSAAACLFFISWLNIKYSISGKYSNIAAIGTAIAATADSIHAIATVAFPELVQNWLALSWAGNRLTILMTFATIFLCHDTLQCSLKRVIALLLAPLVITTSLAVLSHEQIVSLSWVHSQFDILGLTVTRPLDFVLLVGWVLMSFCLRHKSHILFPPNMYWVFMVQGMFVHALMAFGSQESLDMPFLLAHGLKISEYYTFILIYLLYKNQLDNLPRINTVCRTQRIRDTHHHGIHGAVK